MAEFKAKTAAEMRKLAEAATPGPWQNGIEDLEGVVAPHNPGLGNVICTPPLKRMYSSLELWPVNAAYIAAANPSQITAMCDLIAAQARRIEEVEFVLSWILRCDDEGSTANLNGGGGLLDCVDNEGNAYSSADLARALKTARALLSTPGAS